MARPISWIGQALLYGLFALIIGYFSSSPPYRPLPADQALIKLSFSHEGKRVLECHRRTAEELAKLAPNMRAPMDCPRERSPVTVEIELDGTLVYRHVAKPSGLSKDGASTVYHRFPVPSGEHRLAIRLNDDARAAGFNYRREEMVALKPGKVLVIDFNQESGGITLQ
ncbi:MAG TPA: hypothetical protein VLT92_08605 [Burkholderiales bacterium]|nr:hypothetical protein [Burkholderiales bacterium]